MNLEDLTFEEMITPLTRWRATGSTYAHREDFVGWGWVWDPRERAWFLDSDEVDPCLRWAQRLQGVTVERVEP